MDGHVLVACNSLLALQKTQELWITDPNEAHYDLISAIQALCQLLPLKIMFQHHQSG